MTHSLYGPTNLPLDQKEQAKIKRYGSVIELSPEKESYYRQLHAAVWPSVLKQIELSHISNYSIYLAPLSGKLYLFSYFEYSGEDFAGDMKKMANDPETILWWKECIPCQIPLSNRAQGEHWMNLEELFHFNPQQKSL